MEESTKVLIVEDEPVLGRILKENIETQNFEVLLVGDGEEALEAYRQWCPAIIVLDVMLPKKSGFTVAKEIRKEGILVPILFLTAKSQTEDIVEGFRSGGDDYLKKPFSMQELIVRIENLIKRRKREEDNEEIAIGEYMFNLKRQSLQFKDQPEELLTHREAQLLYHLFLHKNTLLDRSVILKKLWGDDDFFSKRSMDVFITRLRKKLQKDKKVQIMNIRGYGYKLVF